MIYDVVLHDGPLWADAPEEELRIFSSTSGIFEAARWKPSKYLVTDITMQGEKTKTAKTEL